jgi:peptidoglycan/LPS O-acetylase OafA/YrhL
MSHSSRHAPVPLIDLGKALASQLIVWHHLAFYSPMRRVVDPLAPALFDWLADSARLAVELFLVMAGFLAARSLMPDPQRQTWLQPADLPQRLWQRYKRLAVPALFAIAIAIAAAALARSLSDDSSIPAAPGWRQLLANVLFLQDIVGEDALSAGLWYVAIDLQLFVLMLGLVALRIGMRRCGVAVGPASVVLVALGTAASLLWANLLPGHDMWASYFFGSYGLGILACWATQHPGNLPRRLLYALGVGLLTCLALWLQWRSRIALAGTVALSLTLIPQGRVLRRWAAKPAVAWLSGASYSIFLVHYPVCLVVDAVSQVLWPESLALNLVSLIGAWILSLMAGQILHLKVEQRHWGQRRAALGRPSQALAAANQ